MTSHPNTTPEVLDLDAIERGHASPRRCGVCDGVSPSWDGHDVNPPCRGYVWESVPALVAEVRRLRGAVSPTREDMWGDVYSEISYHLGIDDSHEDAVDAKRSATDAIMRLLERSERERDAAVREAREALRLAVDMLAMLDAHPSMLGHYLDTDDNDGQRFREAAAALGVEPNEATRERIAALAAALGCPVSARTCALSPADLSRLSWACEAEVRELRALAQRLVDMDDPRGSSDRQTITLDALIEQARAALGAGKDGQP